jgi:uncharacterized membrane protein YjjP (DUF1212 family)
MIDLLPALSIWLVIVGTGLMAVFIARYFVDGDKASVAGFSVAIGMAIGKSATFDRGAPDWWVAPLAVVAGLATLWWFLFKRKEFERA